MKEKILILRPYITLSDESAGIDRYLTLGKFLNDMGTDCKVVTTDFLHNKKVKRKNLVNEDVIFLDCGKYKKNHSLARVLYEITFCIKCILFIYKFKPKKIIIGEPLFGASLIVLLVSRKIIKFCDMIDLMPEAFEYKKNTNSIVKFIFKILQFIRKIRLKFFYDRIIVVSKTYRDYLNLDGERSAVFYWGARNQDCKKTHSPQKITYAGSLGEGYNIESIIDLGKRRPDFEIVIAGSGPKESICIEASHNGYITFRGQLDLKELNILYSETKIGLLPYCDNSAVAMPVKFFDYIDNYIYALSTLKHESTSILERYNLGSYYDPVDNDAFEDLLDEYLKLEPDINTFNELKESFDYKKQYSNMASYILSV